MFKLFVTSVLFCGIVGHAYASPITETYDFDIGPFTGGTNIAMTPPIDPWIGSFTLTFEPTDSGMTGNISSFTSNIPALGNSWKYGVTDDLVNGQTILVLGNDCIGSGITMNCIDQTEQGFIPNTGFIWIDIGPSSVHSIDSSSNTANINMPSFYAAEYTTVSGSSRLVPHFSASAGSFAVPEPSSFAILGVGLIFLRFIMKRILS